MNSSKKSEKVIESGNTSTDSTLKKKQISPSKKWAFTFNNYTEEEYNILVPIIERTCKVAIIGREVGEGGTPHLQGYLEFNKKSRPKSVISVISVAKDGTQHVDYAFGIHWEKAKGTRDQNINYCSKDDKNPWVWGFDLPKVRPPVRTIEAGQLYQWQKDLVTVFKGEPDDRVIYWYWSHKGGIGKTAFSKFLTVKYGAICLHGKGNDVRNGVLDYLVKNGDTPRLIIYPIPRCHGTEYCSYESLENVKDMYFYSGKYEGGMVCGNPPHLIVFANEAPVVEKMSKDRWVIVCIDPENAPKEICEIDSLDC